MELKFFGTTEYENVYSKFVHDGKHLHMLYALSVRTNKNNIKQIII